MIRKINPDDKPKFIAMVKDFYSSNAVLHNIPEANIAKTFTTIISGSPFVKGFMFEYQGEIAGYSLLTFTYSNEAGGLVLWIDELYIAPDYQGKGLGTEIFAFIKTTYTNQVSRIRLEVEKSNQNAIKLYRKHNFTDLGYLQMVKDL
jgi:ribosomal protein S18 acetylase RimI-like enzyme